MPDSSQEVRVERSFERRLTTILCTSYIQAQIKTTSLLKKLIGSIVRINCTTAPRNYCDINQRSSVNLYCLPASFHFLSAPSLRFARQFKLIQGKVDNNNNKQPSRQVGRCHFGDEWRLKPHFEGCANKIGQWCHLNQEINRHNRLAARLAV